MQRLIQQLLRPSRVNVITLTCLLLLISSLTIAQETSTITDGPPDPDLINQKIESISTSTTLDEETSAKLLDLYRRSLSNLERTETFRQSADELAKSITDTPDELDKLQASIDSLRQQQQTPEREVDKSEGVDKLEQLLIEAKTELNDSEARLRDVRSQYTSEVGRPAEARERLTKARTERDAALSDIKSSPPIGQIPEMTEARVWHLKSRVQRLNAEMRKLEQELLSHESRLEVLAARQEMTGLQLSAQRSWARLLEDAISELRGAEAEQALKDAKTARQELVSQHPTIARIAAENVELGDRLTQRTMDMARATKARDEAQEEVSHLVDELSSTANKLAIAGLNQTLGQLLIEQKRTLPDINTLRKEIREREQRVAMIGLEQIELGERRRNLRKQGGPIDQLKAELSEQEIDAFGDELKSLVQTQSELLDKSINSGASYLRTLGELDLAQRQLTDTVKDFKEFLDRTLLWVRTTAPVNPSVLLSLPGDIKTFISPKTWRSFVGDLTSALNSNLFFVFLMLILLAAGFFKSRMFKRIDAYSANVGWISKDRFSDTILVFVLTLMYAAALPALMVLTGYLVELTDPSSPYSNGLAIALIKVGLGLVIIRFFFFASHAKGLLITHCGWTRSATSKLRQELRWYIWVFPISRIITEVSIHVDTGGTLGGLTVVAGTITIGTIVVFLFRLVTPAGGVLKSYLQRKKDSLMGSVLPAGLVLAILILPGLLALWLAGYSYTAEVLVASYVYSFWLLLFLKVLNNLLARWLRLGSQRLALRAAIERRDAARAERAAKAEMTVEEYSNSQMKADEADFDVEEKRIDFAELDSHSRFLLKMIVLFVGVIWLWVIWAPVIPALGVLDDVVLWTQSAMVKGEQVQVPVSLMSILIAALIAVITIILTKGLPALVELVLLHSTNLTAGGRYTAVTLLRYVIIGVGTITVISMLGVSWSKAQWLVAALGVGIGFGLQEIVANFISGLVILFERPIRVGDIVTVGETSGVVTRIQIRATTIRDYDRRELLVPNKEFITSRLLNWSLSDEITRFVINVGIAYGSDVALASKLAEEAAREHPNVLEDPAPFVIFESFGDNALNLSLRVYMPSMEHRMTTVSALNAAINRKFNEAGIVIAFPQRDIHLDTSTPLDIRLHKADSDAGDMGTA